MPIVRHPAGPVLTRADVVSARPHLRDVTSVFNPGAALVDGRVVLLLRVQNRGRETWLVRAESDDGVRFRVADAEVAVRGLERVGARVHHVYDPRVTRLDGRWLVTVALDLDDGCRVGICLTRDFTELELLGLAGDDDDRNGVLFPERFGGRAALLHRPNRVARPGEPATGDAIALAWSHDLARWERAGVVATGRFHYWDELIGAGPPPVKTRDGWLLVYHGVATHFRGVNVYQAGAMLLDLRDPARVVARGRYNILEPREAWELTGQVPNVVFPSGLVVRGHDAEGFARPDDPVLLYYGAADTCVGLVTGTVQDLLDACREGGGA